MVQKNILASILINNFNNQEYINKCLKSCLNQSYKYFEIIIYDDCSNDKSKDIIKNIKNKRIKKIFNKSRKFNSSALNQFNAVRKSFLKSKGEIIFILDGDDQFLKNKLNLIIRKFIQNDKLNFLQDNPVYYYPEQNQKVKRILKNKTFVLHTWPYFNTTSTMVFRRSFLKKLLIDLNFSNKDYGLMFFDARAFIYIYFFEKNYLLINDHLTLYTQNLKGDTLRYYNEKNSNWWKRRFEYHQFVSNLFRKKNKFHFKFIDYCLTYLMNFLLKKFK
tara:strand:+ start:117 stop:941 length:825 start_codon:yes stop_codon:yes gene_type:complete